MKKRHWRFGDRNDGRRVRSLCPMNVVSPYIMGPRNDSQNFFKDSICIDKAEEYIREKKNAGLKSFSFMHVIIASYVRAVSQQPGLNRFISGQRIYARDNIEIVLTVKQELSLNAPETVVKIQALPDDTAEDIYRKMDEVVKSAKNNDNSGFDKTAGFLKHIPGLLLRFTVGLLRGMDYFGLLPRALTKISPFHGSFFITSMGSLGIPPIYHHLYNFGNVPIFCSFGAKYTENVLNSDGSVSKKKFVDIAFVLDERICDGHYYASGMKLIKRYMVNPYILDERPENIIEDVD